MFWPPSGESAIPRSLRVIWLGATGRRIEERGLLRGTPNSKPGTAGKPCGPSPRLPPRAMRGDDLALRDIHKTVPRSSRGPRNPGVLSPSSPTASHPGDFGIGPVTTWQTPGTPSNSRPVIRQLIVIEGRRSDYAVGAFHDDVHLNAHGATSLSVEVASVLKRYLTQSRSEHVWVTLPPYRERSPDPRVEDIGQTSLALTTRGARRR